MNIVYNSDNYYVVEYPQQGYEVVDKQAARGTFFQGDVAERFRASMMGAFGENPSAEQVDEFLSDFGGPISFSMTVH